MLEYFFNPRSVAVIGASKDPEKVGHSILKNIINSGYLGKLYPVNPKAEEILGYKCYSSVLEIDDNLDLAVIAIPAKFVGQVIRECTEKNLKSAIVISAGFKEIGIEGAHLERELVAICKQHNIDLLGPNCLGMSSTYTPINATFASKMPLRGPVGFISQSGALCTGILDWSLEENIGFSRFISLGNKAGLTETEFIMALSEDPETKVILSYIEGVADGKKFLQNIRKATRLKPVIIIKSGVSAAGARAVSSHTGTLAGMDKAYDTAFKQVGIIRATQMEELFDLAEAFSKTQLPNGEKVAIITNAGGPGIIATDAAERYGLKLAAFSSETRERLRTGLPEEAGKHNPIDVLGDAKADRFKLALELVAQDENIDSIIVLLTVQAMTEVEATAEVIAHIRHQFNIPIMTSFIGGIDAQKGDNILKMSGIANFPFPERAVAVMSQLVKYAQYLKEEERELPESLPDINRSKVAEIFRKVSEERRRTLLGHEAVAVANAYGIVTPATELARSVSEAVEIANRIGNGEPVVLKIASPQIIHKTDIGAVRLGIQEEKEIIDAYNQIIENSIRYFPQARIYGVQVQKMNPKGRELIIGMSRDLTFGPMVMFGMGGIFVEVLKDVSFRLAPMSRKDAQEMITETKAAALLRGVRGEPPADINSVVDMILRVSQLVTEFPEIQEMDINPLFAYNEGKGASALDVKINIKQY
ncbi:MAG: acetate--CoA ligase alpha subunit [Promethearchaeota archaeon]